MPRAVADRHPPQHPAGDEIDHHDLAAAAVAQVREPPARGDRRVPRLVETAQDTAHAQRPSFEQRDDAGVGVRDDRAAAARVLDAARPAHRVQPLDDPAACRRDDRDVGRPLRVRRVLRGFDKPRYTAIAPGGRLAYLSDGGSGEIVVIDLVAGRVLRG